MIRHLTSLSLETDTDETLLWLARQLAQTVTGRNAPSQSDLATAQELFVTMLAALREGSTAVFVDEKWRHWLQDQAWVSLDGRLAPVVLHGSLVQFHRYWRAERQIVARFAAWNRSWQEASEKGEIPSLSEPFLAAAQSFGLDAEKLAAIKRALAQPVTWLTGGPGTGKTTTMAWFLAATQQANPKRRVALAAPTGKAAQRMKEALTHAIAALPLDEAGKAALCALEPMTLHRLLGIGRFPEAQFDAQTPLPFDLVVVDEASMVDLLLLEKLVAALSTDAQLLLIGDPNQLASVEAGNVLGDLVRCFPSWHLPLARSHRFTAAIAELADAVIAGNHKTAWRRLAKYDPGAIPESVAPPTCARLEPRPETLVAAIEWGYRDVIERLRDFPQENDFAALADCARDLLGALARFRLLSALRHDRLLGVRALNDRITAHWIDRHRLPLLAHVAGRAIALGQPVVVEENDYALDLFNGDQGVVLPWQGGLFAWFPKPSAAYGMRAVPLTQLPRWESGWALTVHKAQGSEFETVLLTLPLTSNPVVTRELLYTAITRAKARFLLWGDEAAFAAAVKACSRRLSGLTAETPSGLAAKADAG